METAVLNVYPEVERELVAWLARVSPDPRQIDGKISELEERLGGRVYSELLYLLCHLDFPPSTAKSHWTRIIEHREELSRKTGSAVDFRVALLDYFISVNQYLENPKVVEIRIFQKTRDSAIRDELTGLHNYRYFRAELDREIERAEREGSSVSLALFDVDHFKWYNDRNGHLAGDQALKDVARIIRTEVRTADVAARYGGEEFAVILPGARKAAALARAQQICATTADFPFAFGSRQPGGRLTISGGVATYRADAEGAAELVEAADRGLYLAKSQGKNQALAANGETREHPRVDVQVEGRLYLLVDEPQPFKTENASEQGLQFRCAVPVRQGEIFRFALVLEEAGRDVEGLGRALHVRKLDSGCEVGAEVIDMSFSDVQILSDVLEKRNGSE